MHIIRLVILLALSSLAFAYHPAVSEAMVRTAESNVVGEVTGVITGLLDGEPFIVFTVYDEPFEGEEITSAEWRSFGFGNVVLPIEVSIVGFPEGYTGVSAWRNSIWLDFNLSQDLELLLDEDRTVTFAETLTAPYIGDAEIEITHAEWLSDTELAVSGTFSAILTHAYQEDTEAKQIEGEFDVKRVIEDDPFL